MSRDSPVVLLVDDHEDSAAMYAIGLLAMGFQPVTSETAEDAFARACQIRPDVVVADVTLTGTSGIELTRRLRSDRRTKNAAIIVLTGHAVGSISQQATDAGCDRFLLKPCLPDMLALEIRGVLNQRRCDMNTRPQPAIADGATKSCPQCRGMLVFRGHHPILTVDMTLERSGSEIGDRIRYERAWVCENGGCNYRELGGEA